MSTQSIYNLNREDLSLEIDKILIKMSQSHILFKRFGVGCDYNRDDFVDLDWMGRIICEDRCSKREDLDELLQATNKIILKYN